MANHKSAEKRARQAVKRSARNSQQQKSVRTSEKKLLAAINGKDVPVATDLLREVASKLDRAAKKHIIHTCQASRKIGRLSKRVSALTTP